MEFSGCPTLWAGRVYPSVLAAARAAGVHPTTMHRHLNRYGHTDHVRRGEFPPPPGARQVTYRGRVYLSISQLSRVTGISRKTIYNHLRKFGNLERMTRHRGGAVTGRPVPYQGKVYPSISAVARLVGRHPSTLHHHLKTYGTLDRVGLDKGPHGKPVIVDGVIVGNSRTEAAARLGMKRDTLSRCLSPRASKRQRMRLRAAVLKWKGGA